MVRKLAIRNLRKGIWSMDHIHSLLIMEDGLDEEDIDTVGEDTETTPVGGTIATALLPHPAEVDLGPSGCAQLVGWCICSRCRPMPQALENKCRQLRTCTTTSALFVKLCLDLDVLELCIRNMGDIRNDREDSRTRAFQKAAYTQLWEKVIIGSSSKIPKPELFFCPFVSDYGTLRWK